MTTTAPDTGLRAVLARAGAAVTARKQADVDLLTAALDWAHANPATATDEIAGWGDGDLHSEGCLPLAGPGVPLVAEFAPYELAATLGWTTNATRSLIGDALELAHRLPQLWALVTSLQVSVSTARYAAEHTRDLTPQAAAHADWLLTHTTSRGLSSPRRIRTLIDEARLYHDPDRALADEHHALTHRCVRLTPGNTPATVDVAMVLDTQDATALDSRLTQIASILARLGDTDTLDIRRARAVGILADPHTAAGLLDPDTRPDTRPAPTPPTATLYLHLDQTALPDLPTGTAPVRVEGLPHGLSTVSSDLLATWLTGTGCRVVVKPVIDLTAADHVTPTDRHDPPPAMADHVRLRDPVCVFPHCQTSSRHSDLDHIQAYLDPDEGGPPGQTHPHNLAPLCRGHHRAKTHGDWQYDRLPDGSYTWTSPTGQTFTTPARPWR